MSTVALVRRGNWDRPCSDCERPSVELQFGMHVTNNRCYRSSVCNECKAKREEISRDKKPTKVVRNRELQYKWRYGTTRKELEELLAAQHGRCAICATKIAFGFDAPLRPGQTKRNSTARVDHCHESEKIRGLLCTSCNSGLGQFKDDHALLRSALVYLDGAS